MLFDSDKRDSRSASTILSCSANDGGGPFTRDAHNVLFISFKKLNMLGILINTVYHTLSI